MNPDYVEIIEELISCDTGRVKILKRAPADVNALLFCREPHHFSAMWLDYTGTITNLEELFYCFGIATREYWDFGKNVNTLRDYLLSDMTIPQNGCLLYYGNAAPIKKEAPEHFDALIEFLMSVSRIWQKKGVFFGAVIVVPDD